MRPAPLMFLTLFLALPAQADSPRTHEVSLGLGSAMADGSESFDLGVAYALGYRHHFNPYLALSAGYAYHSGGFGDFLSLGFLKESLDYSGAQLGVQGRLPLTHWFSLYAEVGGHYGRVRHTVARPGQERVDEHYGLRPYAGGGVEFLIKQQVGLALEYQYFEFAESFSGETVMFRFGYRF
ncbi:porin family protein [Ferrimonas balearica]|uniref:porin family protein n=1 Tax=Ferrimonas balearica TaxID=44012 RepID=UPI001C98F97D|nr:porin family protein [Ferrimonas balearica]MBY5991105.1 porin family protein [Ferrimonas balearica]